MADNKNQGKGQANQDNNRSDADRTIGNQQGTTQTGAQNNGGKNRDMEDDTFSRDLRKSGNRPSSNTEEES